ncbi:hypothetical protein BDP27DRAFT_1375545 [Rhodocollybia butyracea]|uniref:Uncharacterized protein n=1 Tax=Rhodocollybia butyracea TaxID=206335 RepID=A0A9P5P1Y0_9AGAR|nr:hypothetical protein BDP27DRAFT_1375545 [Rhodocollybia butyracea]
MPQWCKSTTIPEAVQLFQPTPFMIADFKSNKGAKRSISYEFCHVVEASTPADELLKIMYACGGWLGSNSRANAFPRTDFLGVRSTHLGTGSFFISFSVTPKTMDAVKKYLLFLLDWYEDGKNPAVDWLSLLRQFSPELCDGNFHRVSFARNKDCPPLHLIRLSEEKPDPAGKLPRSSIFADITRIIFEIAASPVLVIARLHNSLQSQPFWKIITEAAPDRYSDSNHDTEFLANVRLAIIFGCLMRKDGRNFTFPDDAGGGGGGGGGGGSEGDSGGSGGSSEGNSEGNSGSNEGNGDGGGGWWK